MVADLRGQARSRIDRLEPSAALSAAQEGVLLIDTRGTEQRCETGIIPGSACVPVHGEPMSDPYAGERKGLVEAVTRGAGHLSPEVRTAIIDRARGQSTTAI